MACGLLDVVPAGAVAQATAAPGDSTHAAPAPLFTGKDALIGAAFVGATIAFFPLDQRLAKHLENPGAQANRFFRHAATGLEVFTSPGAYFIGGGLYAVGRLGHFERVADLGWHGTESVFVADAVTLLLKGMAGRARPFVVSDTNAHAFKFGRGFTNSDYQSFPSGHATTAFAAAAAVTAETGRWWPRSTWVVGPLMYGGASLVGLSRMYHNRHWASDVALGAAIGTFAGQKVVQYSHAHPTNFIDRVILRTAVLPDGAGGYVLAVTLR
ncbi:MAG TPA: phosphatase PAP2 family protein [Gemmatimonadaceae bacterium]|nr:phosphatase PAP2 family protein [Gemmatimonadaceae bacterium]